MSKLKNNLIAKKYSMALANLSLEQNSLDDLELVNSIFLSNRELLEILNSPSIDLDSKKKIIQNIFSGKVQAHISNLLLILLEKRRINLIPLLAENYRIIFFAHKNIGIAQIQSATEFQDHELTEIKNQLEKSFNQEVKISTSINPELIAGLKINISGKVVDSSLKTKLKKIKTLLGA
jgi:F-type H+-transporting ATPase subunit delta